MRNHAHAIAAIDLCVVPTLTFECLFAFLVLGHGRRQLLWFAVTRHPTAEWLAQQIVEGHSRGARRSHVALFEIDQRQRVASAPRPRPLKGAPNVVGTPAIVGTPCWTVRAPSFPCRLTRLSSNLPSRQTLRSSDFPSR
jgi:hypothetical protein